MSIKTTDTKGEYRYFLYSSTQEKELQDVNDSMGKRFVPGTVFVQGTYKNFTQISSSPDNPLYGDTVIIAKGYLNKMKYTKAKSVWKVQAR